ncbi:hypothetical protein [Streptosporangium sp. NBC_01756]|uniref:hypothetical protein n=1 Tax=Streptosporangium sp. NBC_01756 TaxID=2975950 RepID=UPI002DDA868D|nr:hypothetical protein [Streptosporangium sp. NBC_01756]WSC84838.1 hypothetical protein OIE48_31350 [Streptosporangium sp. NBC_01756]
MRRVVGCALLVVLLAAGCTSGGPTLDEAAQVLAADAKKLESSYSMAGKKTVDKTGDENDDAAGCPGGTATRSYQFSGSFDESGQMTPAEQAERADLASDPLQSNLVGLGYEIDRSASWARPGRSSVVLHKKDPGITFILLIQDSAPNIEIIGKTDCLPSESRSERNSQKTGSFPELQSRLP